MGVPNSALPGVADGLLAQFTRMAVGTDATAFAVTQTALGAETDRWTGLTTSKVTVNTTDDTARFEGTYTFPAARTGLNEFALLDAPAGGSMLERQTYGDLNVQAGDQMYVRADVTADQ
jgi:hypothetical protein